MKNLKYIFVSGGVMSGLGKGVVAASIGKILHGKKIVPIKCDGYFNVDPGTMNPIEHGEVFVLDDGSEVDLDFGHYERFLNIPCVGDCSLTSGKILQKMMQKERRGDYLGQTVQIIPHITELIREEWKSVGEKYNADIVLIELGGTVGDLENLWFLEAAREVLRKNGPDKVLFVHLGYVPDVGQQKTKPFQQSLQHLRERGIFPDILVGRSKNLLTESSKKKLHWLCNVPLEAIYSSPDLESVYELPLVFDKEGMGDFLVERLNLGSNKSFMKKNIAHLEKWEGLVESIKFYTDDGYLESDNGIEVWICGKYTELDDSYLSIKEALMHSMAKVNRSSNWHRYLNIRFIDTEKRDLADEASEYFNPAGVIIPGGFGSRGTDGKIKAVQYCRENNIPFLGICYGLQLAVVEFARNVCGLEKAHTTEVDPDTPHPIIDILPEQKNITEKGGTMRLGACEAEIKEKTKVYRIYNKDEVSERHRHRYEVNPEFHDVLEKNGMVISGKSKEDKRIAEFVEIKGKDFFVGTQAHPELKSTLENPSPLFFEFIKSCIKADENKKKDDE